MKEQSSLIVKKEGNRAMIMIKVQSSQDKRYLRVYPLYYNDLLRNEVTQMWRSQGWMNKTQQSDHLI